jgi:mannose/fructose/N-acetylgalactosamine-specific phosphotransferase system component IID/mannose/fructose/N-acetylgalactosamine-specific phosphotransferase system component IIC
MSVIQSALIAFFYAFALSSFNAGLGPYVLSQPLVAGTIVGLLLGDPLRGAAIGGALNLSTLALSNLRLRVGPDVALVGYIGIPLMLLGGLSADAPQTATLFGALIAFGLLLNFARGAFNSVIAHWADYFAERGDVSLVVFTNIVPTQVWLFITAFVPGLVLLRFNPTAVVSIASLIPNWVQSAFGLSQQLLSALGIALSLRLVMQGSSVAYFLLGWLVAPYLGPVPATLLGGSIAIIHAYLARKRMEANQETLVADVLPSLQSEAEGDGDASAPSRRISDGDLRASFLLWMFFHNAGLNFERLQNMGFASAFAPVINRLCTSAKERTTMLRRHLTLFGSEWAFGAAVVGATATLEERRANGDNGYRINDAEFVGAKTGVMAAIDAVGNAIVIGAITSFLVALGAALALQGNLLGPFLFAVAEATAVLAIAYFSFRLGYTHMRRAGDWARANDWLRAGLFGAMRLGAFVLGMLVVTFVPLGLPSTAVIEIGEAKLALQTRVLDMILPNILPLAATLILWWLLRYRRVNPMVLLGACLAVAFAWSLVMSWLGWV